MEITLPSGVKVIIKAPIIKNIKAYEHNPDAFDEFIVIGKCKCGNNITLADLKKKK